jgi:hypothetical protein
MIGVIFLFFCQFRIYQMEMEEILAIMEESLEDVVNEIRTKAVDGESPKDFDILKFLANVIDQKEIMLKTNK